MSPRALRAPPLWLVPASPPPAAACCPVCGPQPVAATAVGQAFATFLRLEVAQGAATADTQRGYWSQVRAWAAWCQAQACCLATAPATAVKAYRQALVEAGLRLLAAVPRTDTVSALRDRALLALLALQGLRTVEITRANVEDLYSGEPVVLRVRGKTRDRLLPLRPDLTAVLQAYLAARGVVASDAAGTPLLTAVGHRAGGHRLSRRGVRYVVDGYLRQAGLKRPGVSDHALRHTAATLAYKYTRDLRAVQHMLGHADPRTTARYAHLVERLQQNPALAVPVGV